ncbi:hypothetical protein PIROE2DRAFT_61397 [Piromyces sp. E2]|nr:hypothetical protein PIROE2DRAFT_61397 [Piromyces sp. E2]|eukprot:OUM63225.1 hypothetical protein PIROE2DRAFT_61397 [Piromyces sp. E2]
MLVQQAKATDCDTFEIIHSKLGNVLGEANGTCCEYSGITCDEQQNIKEINLSNKSIKAEIPSEFGELSNLEVLDLSNNAFNGKIPKELKGYIPYDIKYLINVEDVKLNDNVKLSGFVPNFPKISKCDYSSTALCHLQGLCEGNVKECIQHEVFTSNMYNDSPSLYTEEYHNTYSKPNSNNNNNSEDNNSTNDYYYDINKNNNNKNDKESSILKVIKYIGIISLIIFVFVILCIIIVTLLSNYNESRIKKESQNKLNNSNNLKFNYKMLGDSSSNPYKNYANSFNVNNNGNSISAVNNNNPIQENNENLTSNVNNNHNNNGNIFSNVSTSNPIHPNYTNIPQSMIPTVQPIVYNNNPTYNPEISVVPYVVPVSSTLPQVNQPIPIQPSIYNAQPNNPTTTTMIQPVILPQMTQPVPIPPVSQSIPVSQQVTVPVVSQSIPVSQQVTVPPVSQSIPVSQQVTVPPVSQSIPVSQQVTVPPVSQTNTNTSFIDPNKGFSYEDLTSAIPFKEPPPAYTPY